MFTYRHAVMMIKLTWLKSVRKSVLVFTEQLTTMPPRRRNSKVKRKTKAVPQAFKRAGHGIINSYRNTRFHVQKPMEMF